MTTKNKNADKKARVFNLDDIFQQTKSRLQEENKLKTLTQQTLTDEDPEEYEAVEIVNAKIDKSKDEKKQKGDEESIGPMPPVKVNSDKNEDDEDQEEYVEDDETGRFPIESHVKLNHSKKQMTALSIDSAGSRLVTGANDHTIKFWDFTGMNASLQSFRCLTPCDGYPINDVKFTHQGDMILVVSASAQPKVLDRDGHQVMECLKGDQYMLEQKLTRGHTATVNAGFWNPRLREEFMTCSIDCTVRLWNVNIGSKPQTCIKVKNTKGKKVIPTVCAYSRNGKLVVAGCQDGSIQMWDHGRFYVNHAFKNMSAHQSDVSSVCFSYDDSLLATRSTDDTLKLWDFRKFKTPLFEIKGLNNLYSNGDCCFGPKDDVVMTSVSAEKDGSTATNTGGKLVFYDRKTFEKLLVQPVCDSSVIRCLWHPRINQIICTSAEGKAHIFFGEKSHRGAKISVAKKAKAKKIDAIGLGEYIFNPVSLPLFKDQRPSMAKKRAEKERQDPVKSRLPQLPMDGPGSGGRLGSHGATLAQYLLKQITVRETTERDLDPRGAILRHAEEAEKNPFYIAPAYKLTQPKAVFNLDDVPKAPPTTESDEPPAKKAK